VGSPGAGKGTQSYNIKCKYNVPHLSILNLPREAAEQGTEAGKKAQNLMNAGEHVPDDVMFAIVKDNIMSPACKNGFILDGFPRNLSEAQKLDKLLKELSIKMDKVILIKIDDTLLEKRIVGRRIHKPSGRTYHIEFNPPKEDGKDDVTGEPLTNRSDDTTELLQKRLLTYHGATIPILEYYEAQHLLVQVDGSCSLKEVWDQVDQVIQSTLK